MGPSSWRRGRRRGVAMAVMATALLVLLGVAGLSIDVGLLVVAANECQIMADAGTLAGAQELPDAVTADVTARSVALKNGSHVEADRYTVGVTTFVNGEEVPGYGPAPEKGALRVTVSKLVNHRFLKVLGRESSTVTRSAAAVRRETGSCIAPMWIDWRLQLTYGLHMDLHHCDDPANQSSSYGIFGWLDPQGGVDFDDALQGLLTPEEAELQRVFVGDYVYNRPGQAVGHWMQDLETDYYSRIRRASRSPWTADTFNNFRRDNPRLLIVPMVEYMGATGGNAYFKVKRFACFWLEDCTNAGQDKIVSGRFVDFGDPGGVCPVRKPSGLVR